MIFDNYKCMQQNELNFNDRFKEIFSALVFYAIKQSKKAMPAFLEKFSLFPYMSFWRISSRSHFSNKFAGLISLLLILAFLGITLAKIIEVCQMTTINATQRTQIQTIPSKINLTTSYTDPNMDQFMFGIKPTPFSDSPSFQPTDFRVYLSHVNQTYDKTANSYSYQGKNYFLQQCTQSHFYKMQNIDLRGLYCFPINRTFEIGGSEHGNFSYLAVNIECQNTACQSQSNSLSFVVFTLDTFVNPMNASNPFMTYTSRYQTTFLSNQRNRNFLFVKKNSLTTDNSLLPFSKESTIISLQTSDHSIANSYPSLAGSNGAFFISYSGTNVIHQRSYLKLLDAFAYLGGIFNALLGAFFFMNASGCFFFEMDLADKLFKNSKLKEITFLTHLKQAVYSILSIFKQPKWETSKYVSELRTDVNNLLDIVYLQRRLQFLEKGMEVLFEKHHLKGLYLAHEVTKEGAETNFKNFELNEKFDQFLSKKSKSIKSVDITNQQLGEDKESNKNLKGIEELKIDQFPKKNLDSNKNDRLEYLGSIKAKDSILFNQRTQGQNSQDPQNQQQNTQKYSLKEGDLMALLKLFREAKQKRGDNRSRKIYEKIDSKLRQALQEMFKQQIPRIRTSLTL